jgi:Spy/CpxP family protein refolding chaperone
MKLSTRIVTAVLLVVGSSGVVYAFSKHGEWGMTPQEKADFVSERVGKKLELDADQQQKFDALAGLVAGIVAEARADRAAQMEEISALLEEPSFNQARALELIGQKTALVDEKAPLVISSLAIFLDSLTAEQKGRLQEFIEHRRHHHRLHHEAEG